MLVLMLLPLPSCLFFFQRSQRYVLPERARERPERPFVSMQDAVVVAVVVAIRYACVTSTRPDRFRDENQLNDASR